MRDDVTIYVTLFSVLCLSVCLCIFKLRTGAKSAVNDCLVWFSPCSMHAVRHDHRTITDVVHQTAATLTRNSAAIAIISRT